MENAINILMQLGGGGQVQAPAPSRNTPDNDVNREISSSQKESFKETLSKVDEPSNSEVRNNNAEEGNNNQNNSKAENGNSNVENYKAEKGKPAPRELGVPLSQEDSTKKVSQLVQFAQINIALSDLIQGTDEVLANQVQVEGVVASQGTTVLQNINNDLLNITVQPVSNEKTDITNAVSQDVNLQNNNLTKVSDVIQLSALYGLSTFTMPTQDENNNAATLVGNLLEGNSTISKPQTVAVNKVAADALNQLNLAPEPQDTLVEDGLVSNQQVLNNQQNTQEQATKAPGFLISSLAKELVKNTGNAEQPVNANTDQKVVGEILSKANSILVKQFSNSTDSGQKDTNSFSSDVSDFSSTDQIDSSDYTNFVDSEFSKRFSGLIKVSSLDQPHKAEHAGKYIIHTPVDEVQYRIASAIHDGHSKIHIKLEPAELGRVDVRLDVNNVDNKVNLVITTDKPETLKILQEDSKSLEKALMDVGFKSESTSLSFNLRGNNEQWKQQQDFLLNLSGNENAGTDEQDVSHMQAYMSGAYLSMSNNALDIMV